MMGRADRPAIGLCRKGKVRYQGTSKKASAAEGVEMHLFQPRTSRLCLKPFESSLHPFVELVF